MFRILSQCPFVYILEFEFDHVYDFVTASLGTFVLAYAKRTLQSLYKNDGEMF